MIKKNNNSFSIFNKKGPKRAVTIFLLIAMAAFFIGCGARIDISDGTETETTESAAASSTAEKTETSSATQTTVTASESNSTSTSTSAAEEATTTTVRETEPVRTTEKNNDNPTRASVPDVTKAAGKVIAFTFDDGPNNSTADDASTKMILDKLESLGMKATFFVVGHRLKSSSKTNLQRMLDLGCDIGNHSYEHPNYNKMTLSEVKEEISKTNKLVKDLVGYTPFLMRPPYGNLKRDYAKEIGMTVICWDVDTMDWDYYGKNYKSKSMEEIADMVYDYSLTKIYSSSKIILMHDIYQSTAIAFCKLADKLVADGYTLVSISELLGSENLKNTTTYYGFDEWPS